MNAMPCACVIGGSGFIGRHLIKRLREQAWHCYVPLRDDTNLYSENLGHVFYCAGLTADFRERPFDTVNAHVSFLAQILERSKFQTLTYLSSTRVYSGAVTTWENGPLTVRSDDASDLYNLSKLMGESLCLQSGRLTHIARLSNVYGNHMPAKNFLADILSQARTKRQVRFQTSPQSEKDYIAIQDVVRILPEMALSTGGGIVNLASGHNFSHQQLADCLTNLGVDCEFENAAPLVQFPVIDTKKMTERFGGVQHDLATELSSLLNDYSEAI